MRDPGEPHPHALHVLLEIPVAVEAALLLDGGREGLRPQGDLLLFREGNDGQLGASGDRVGRAAGLPADASRQMTIRTRKRLKARQGFFIAGSP